MIAVHVEKKKYTTWTRLEISRSMEKISGSFRFFCANLDTDSSISPGDAVTIKHNSMPIITGFVDAMSSELSATDRSVEVVGRDATGDLVDCSHIGKSREFSGQPFLNVAKALCRPFGIEVSGESSFVSRGMKIDPGEAVFDALDKEARNLALLLQPDGNGGLVVTHPTSRENMGLLGEGKDILSGSCARNYSSRYNEYHLKGMSEDFEPFSKTARDNGVSRYRPLVIIADSHMQEGDAQKRVEWESIVRNDRSMEVYLELFGWTRNEKLWSPGQLCTVNAPKMGVIRKSMIVRDVTLLFDRAGTRSQLVLTGPDALKKEKSKKSKSNNEISKFGYG